jgi:hypothetical protein
MRIILRIKFYIIFFLILLLILIYEIILNNYKKIKVCLCTIGKYENNYIVEFVEHYFKYNIDKIFLYDNNDINGERFEKIIYKYIKINFVEIINYRGQKRKQLTIFHNCYKKNYINYDWLLFFDIDEFINLKGFSNIKKFLKQKKFYKCESIYLNWVIHTDNNLLYYDNKTLYKRFPDIYKNKEFCRGKTILKGNIKKKLIFQSTHFLDYKIGRCNGFGRKIIIKNINCKSPDYKFYYIDHFYSKSTEEFINKIIKGDAIFGNNKHQVYRRIYFYFSKNRITLEKINLIKRKSGLNISIVKNKLYLGGKMTNLKIHENIKI